MKSLINLTIRTGGDSPITAFNFFSIYSRYNRGYSKTLKDLFGLLFSSITKLLHSEVTNSVDPEFAVRLYVNNLVRKDKKPFRLKWGHTVCV